VIEKSSSALDSGSVIAISDSTTPIFDVDDLDHALFFIVTNNSDTDMTLVLDDGAGAITVGHGIVLKSGGGVWREESWAGALRARHNGAGGTKNLSVVVAKAG
jgi:hypothetical protein